MHVWHSGSILIENAIWYHWKIDVNGYSWFRHESQRYHIMDMRVHAWPFSMHHHHRHHHRHHHNNNNNNIIDAKLMTIAFMLLLLIAWCNDGITIIASVSFACNSMAVKNDLLNADKWSISFYMKNSLFIICWLTIPFFLIAPLSRCPAIIQRSARTECLFAHRFPSFIWFSLCSLMSSVVFMRALFV